MGVAQQGDLVDGLSEEKYGITLIDSYFENGTLEEGRD